VGPPNSHYPLLASIGWRSFPLAFRVSREKEPCILDLSPRTSPSLSGQYPSTASSSIRFHVPLNLFYSTSLSVFVPRLLFSTSANRLSNPHFSKVAVQSLHPKTLAYHLCKSALQKQLHKTQRLLRCFPSLLSSGRSFEGRLSCIPFKVDIRTSVETSTNLLHRHILGEL